MPLEVPREREYLSFRRMDLLFGFLRRSPALSTNPVGHPTAATSCTSLTPASSSHQRPIVVRVPGASLLRTRLHGLVRQMAIFEEE